MKIKLYILLLCFFLLSCDNSTPSQRIQKIVVTSHHITNEGDTTITIKDSVDYSLEPEVVK